MKKRILFLITFFVLATSCANFGASLGKEIMIVDIGGQKTNAQMLSALNVDPQIVKIADNNNGNGGHMLVYRDGLFVIGEAHQGFTFHDQQTSGTAIMTHDKATLGALGSAAIGVAGGVLMTGTPQGAVVGGVVGAVAKKGVVQTAKEQAMPVPTPINAATK